MCGAMSHGGSGRKETVVVDRGRCGRKEGKGRGNDCGNGVLEGRMEMVETRQSVVKARSQSLCARA